ncbi:MAG: tetratricopeptide repeat protein [Fimbriimonadales bacterium]|nr:tetratricopeptide repeat protein [Fimbriimonadales bacterium]
MAIITLVVTASYWNATQGEFVYDDQRQIVENHLIQSPSLALKALTSDVWSFKQEGGGVSNYYRPTFVAALIVNYYLFGDAPIGWHIVNIVIHLAASALLFLLLIRLDLEFIVALMVACIFAAHPVHVESVTWVSGMPDPLMTAFLLGSLLIYVTYRARMTIALWGAVLALFLLALGSKEIAVSLVPILFVTEIVLSRNSGLSKLEAIKAAALRSLPLLLIAIAFFAFRGYVLGSAGVKTAHGGTILDVFLTVPSALVFYLKQTFLPINLAPTHSLRMVTLDNISATNFWLPLLAISFAIAMVVWLAKTNRLVWVGFALFVFPLMPAFDIRLFPPEDIARDRYLYLPLAGAFLLFALFVSFLGRILFREHQKRVFIWQSASLGLLTLACVALTLSYNPVWGSSILLWERGVAANPTASFAWVHLSDAYRHAGERTSAIEAAKKAVEFGPDQGRAHLALGMSLDDARDFSGAEAAYRGVLEDREVGGLAAGRLAIILSVQSRWQEAVSVLKRAAEVEPKRAAVHLVNLAVVYGRSGDTASALKTLEEVRPSLSRDSSPEALRGLILLGDVYRQYGRISDAKECYRQFLEITSGTVSPALLQSRTAAADRLQQLGG